MTPDSFHANLDEETKFRLGIQRRAQHNLRRHIQRAAVRFLVLVTADLASFVLMRELLRGVRDYALLGQAFAHDVGVLLPKGALTGWQFPVALFLSLLVTGSYGQGDHRRSAGRLMVSAALAVALPLNWLGVWGVLEYALTTTLIWVGLIADRLTIDWLTGIVRNPVRDAARTLFVGRADECRRYAAAAAFAKGWEFTVVGVLDSAIPPDPASLGHLSSLRRALEELAADTVVICGYLPDSDFHDVVDAAMASGCHLLTVPRSVELGGVTPSLFWRDGQPLVELTRPALRGQQLVLKRVLDVVGSIVGLLMLSPLLLVIRVLVRLDSPGPGVFSQRRLGRNGRVFRCFKFRSMHEDAESKLHCDPALYAEYRRNNFKLAADRDPRLTRVGRVLRHTSLDELPQLFNVLAGEMSLVGPRPIVPEELQQYNEWAPLFLSLKPGMTGAWAVNGRSRVSYPDRADLELDYVRSWSLLRDIGILLRTVPVVLRRVGAH